MVISSIKLNLLENNSTSSVDTWTTTLIQNMHSEDDILFPHMTGRVVLIQARTVNISLAPSTIDSDSIPRQCNFITSSEENMTCFYDHENLKKNVKIKFLCIKL